MGKKQRTGYVLGFVAQPTFETKAITSVLDPIALLPADWLKLAAWMKHFYAATMGEVMHAMTLKSFITQSRLVMVPTGQEGKPLTPAEQAWLMQLEKAGQWDWTHFQKQRAKEKHLFQAVQKKGWVKVVPALKKQKGQKKKVRQYQISAQASEHTALGQVERQIWTLLQENPDQWWTAKQIQKALQRKTMPTQMLKNMLGKNCIVSQDVWDLAPEVSFETRVEKTLSDEQQAVLEKIKNALALDQSTELLLQGVTGSGKTEVYIQAVRACLAKGKTAMALVPEISLTPQFVDRFAQVFGQRIAVLHSHRSDSERVTEWYRILEGEVDLVIGTRSAVFAPLSNIGLVILDESHDHSYKQQDGLRYDAIAVAMHRAQQHDAVVLRGSATPTVETFHRFYQKPDRLLTLSQRATGQQMPEVTIIDAKDEVDFGKKKWITQPLQEAMVEALEQQRQVLLFLNRRGYAHVVFCAQCGKEVHCPHCSVTLTYHKIDDVARCHYCHYEHEMHWPCPSCKQGHLIHFGTGTERVEEELSFLFPDARIARLDRDQTSRKYVYQDTMRGLLRGNIDILLGTQMITKGLDVANIALVGILWADHSLHFPDFRAPETTFQLITQVVGRSGRGSYRGKAMIQTLQPDHPSIVLGAKQDFHAFYQSEIAMRKEMMMPPFSSMVLFEGVGLDQQKLTQMMQWFSAQLRQQTQADADTLQMGPGPAPIMKIRDDYRMHLVLSSPKKEALFHVCRHTFGRARDEFAKRQLRLIMNIDPISFL